MSVKMLQRVEREIAERIISDMLAAGYLLGVNDGWETTLKYSRDKSAVINAMFTTGEDYLLVYRKGEPKHFGWVFFVYGNDGWDVVNDYSTNLESVMEPINKWIDETYAD